jgi:hypothetical protein
MLDEYDNIVIKPLSYLEFGSKYGRYSVGWDKYGIIDAS